MAIDTQMTVTPQVRKLETSANYGKFDIEPLDPGFGTTLGNTLRRVLLSSLWGAAVTSIQIDGVAHEFTAIPHVKEDVTEVILNLSGRGQLVEAAANLFNYLRTLDGYGIGSIAVMPIPEEGLGEAINDRLRHAAAPRHNAPRPRATG